jgi:hypothetical protein
MCLHDGQANGPLTHRYWIEVQTGSGGRSRTALTTPEGLKTLDAAAPLWEAMQIAIIDRFGRSAWNELVAALRRLEPCIPEPEDHTT